MRFSDVKVLVWDFDGTLYRAVPAFHQVILDAAYKVVAKHTGWSLAHATEEFHKVYKVTTPSSTETAAKLSGIPLKQAAIECELAKEDRAKFISRDEKLIDMFRRLSGFTHFILANGIREKVLPALDILGVPRSTFVDVVTSEVVGVTKPQPDGFLYIMKESGLPASAHMMIGDRETVDLVPAKKLGMRTCYVWSEEKSLVADVTIPTVYEILDVLG